MAGVGLNDSGYITRYKDSEGKRVECPIYNAWRNMLGRCYGGHPSYKDCSVTPEWHRFSAFAEWAEPRYLDGYELDKDLLDRAARVYSPETCIFVPVRLNRLLNNRSKARGKYPCGVSYDSSSKRMRAGLSVNGNKKNIASFPTAREAESAYLITRGEYLKTFVGFEGSCQKLDQRINQLAEDSISKGLGQINSVESVLVLEAVERFKNKCLQGIHECG